MGTAVGPASDVIHGYTWGEVEQIALHAVRQYRRGRIAGFHEYLDEARAAIHDRLIDAVEPPDETDLLRAAGRAILAYTYQWEREHGWNHKALNDRPRFIRFWTNPHPGRPEDLVVDRLAVRQILPTLTPAMRDALAMLVLYDGDSRRAAAALGLGYSAFKMRIKTARERFQALWFEGQTPPRPIWRATNPATHMRHNGLRVTCLRWHGPDCGCWYAA